MASSNSFGSASITPGGQTNRTQSGGLSIPSNNVAQKYDGVNEAVSGEQLPQKHPNVFGAVDRLYAMNEGVQPYPRRNEPPDMGTAIYSD